MKRAPRRLRVDPVACDGFGYCAELLPEHVGRDEWGYPVVSPEVVPPRLLDAARRCVASCPRNAISLVPALDAEASGASLAR